ncbi:MAG: DNA-binding protein [Candidatus Micrarchaeota archaeon]
MAGENESDTQNAQGEQAKMQEAYRRKYAEMQKDAQIKAMLRASTEPAAYERLFNIRLSNPELYEQLVKVIFYLRQQGQARKVSEDLLKQLIAKILSQRKESRISFARK